MRLVFMGTPDFAIPSLEKLHREQNVVGVITAPDKPAGRGKKLKPSAIKVKAEELGLSILQPTNLKDGAFIQELAALNAELFVVVAFRMLPEIVWSMPERGTINLHGSLLPHYRGAAPINWAIINGEKETGLTTFFIEKNIDTGEIIDNTKLSIGPNETAGDLHDKMMRAGAELVTKTVKDIEAGKAESHPQRVNPDIQIKRAPKIFREDCRIDWTKSAAEVHNQIRGLSPFPGAWTESAASGADQTFKIFQSRLGLTTNTKPGMVRVQGEDLAVATRDGWVKILELQAPGKKRMKTADFLRGFQFENDFQFQ